ncbi:hypothetical protein C4K68_03045 [Pokkaliibacter plantistimulans]|uniref:Phosphoribulokinase/uridine kinase domain-containing protein n=1 Tax=Proteobacteria bacterium 228 TaxID=2083153 RepID=A0A2S5KW06_9PROT|nr:hypothetical protein [Pokkaliibacter plantistimulans]PPC78832.1 hypothetical protein C4K68_03045 [Pokkaliibacter plantistimulans]
MSTPALWPQDRLALTDVARAQAVKATEQAFARTLTSLQIDIGLVRVLEAIYVPLAAWVVAGQERLQRPMVLGINGAQGAGKSTLSNLLEIILSAGFGKRVVVFSIDDLYKTREERERLASEVHPLLMTRGVPGTHDIDLGLQLIESVKQAERHQATKIPVFDKSIDDRCDPMFWQEWEGSADVIIFEGWCVGAKPQADEELIAPVNTLEEVEDDQQTWRRYVNEQLKGLYAELFEQLDALVMLKVPSMEAVYAWRTQQEQKLAERVRMMGTHHATDGLRIMDAEQIRRFIMHYERITRHTLAEMPARADVTLHLNQHHQIASVQLR